MSGFHTVQIGCPYCGERNDLSVDVAGAPADYVEDCTVCCRPILLHVARGEGGLPVVSATMENE